MDATVKRIPHEISHVSGDIGRGLVAGFIGTLAITLSQMIEMKITKRAPSSTPVEAAGKVIGFEPKGEEQKEKLTNMVHFSYGTTWGEVRALISSLGLKGWKASLVHFGAIWGTAMVMLPSLKVAPPVKEWGVKSILKDGLHHAVYAFTAGLIYDQLHKNSC
jgi:hypothetical protein